MWVVPVQSHYISHTTDTHTFLFLDDEAHVSSIPAIYSFIYIFFPQDWASDPHVKERQLRPRLAIILINKLQTWDTGNINY